MSLDHLTEEVDLLETDLAGAYSDWLVAFHHRPPYCSHDGGNYVIVDGGHLQLTAYRKDGSILDTFEIYKRKRRYPALHDRGRRSSEPRRRSTRR